MPGAKSYAEYKWLIMAGVTISDASVEDGPLDIVTPWQINRWSITVGSWPIRGLIIRPGIEDGITAGIQCVNHLGIREVVHKARILSKLNGLDFDVYGGVCTQIGETVSQGVIVEADPYGLGYNPGTEIDSYAPWEQRIIVNSDDAHRFMGNVVSAPFWHDWTSAGQLVDNGDATFITGTTMDGHRNTYIYNNDSTGKGSGSFIEEESLGVLRGVLANGVSTSEMVPEGATYNEGVTKYYGFPSHWIGRTLLFLGSDISYMESNSTDNFRYWRSKRYNQPTRNVRNIVGLPPYAPPDAEIYHAKALNANGTIDVDGAPWGGVDLAHSHAEFFGDIGTPTRTEYSVMSNTSGQLSVGVNPLDYGIPVGSSFYIRGILENNQLKELMDGADAYRQTWGMGVGAVFSWSDRMSTIRSTIEAGGNMNDAAVALGQYPIIDADMLNELHLAWHPFSQGLSSHFTMLPSPQYQPITYYLQYDNGSVPENFWTLTKEDEGSGYVYALTRNSYISVGESPGTEAGDWTEHVATVPDFPQTCCSLDSFSPVLPDFGQDMDVTPINYSSPPGTGYTKVNVQEGQPGTGEFWVNTVNSYYWQFSVLYYNQSFEVSYTDTSGHSQTKTITPIAQNVNFVQASTSPSKYWTTYPITCKHIASGEYFTKVTSFVQPHPTGNEYAQVAYGSYFGISLPYARKNTTIYAWREGAGAQLGHTMRRIILSFPSFSLIQPGSMSNIAIRIPDMLSFMDYPLNKDFDMTMRSLEAGYFVDSRNIEDIPEEDLWDQELVSMGTVPAADSFHWSDYAWNTGVYPTVNEDEKLHVVIKFSDETNLTDETSEYLGREMFVVGYRRDENVLIAGGGYPDMYQAGELIDRIMWAYAFSFAYSLETATKFGGIVNLGVFAEDPRYYLLD